jgi:hypothetical protein
MDDRERRIEEMERRLEDLELRGSAMERALSRSRAASEAIVPEETRRHLRAAGREQLLAVRSMLDYWITRMRDEGERDEAAGGSRENIEVE